MIVETVDRKLPFFDTDKRILSKQVIFLIGGKAGAGKTTLAVMIQDELKRNGFYSIRTAFASGVKRLAREYFNWDEIKNEPGRDLLQKIGNHARQIDKNVWVNLVSKFIYDSGWEYDFFIIDDWRFPNEFTVLDGMEGYQVFTIKIKSNIRFAITDEKLANDESETSLDNVSGDYNIVNDFLTLEELREYVNTDLIPKLIGG
jgi:adenylate kinase family enzyme